MLDVTKYFLYMYLPVSFSEDSQDQQLSFS
jgi:hypothetical protein